MTMRFVSLLVVTLAVGNALAGTRERIVVSAFRVMGNDDVPVERREQARASFIGGLLAAGAETVREDEVQKQLSEVPELARCETDACFQALARRLGVRFVVAGQVEIIGSSYTLTVRVVNADKGDIGVALRETCSPCRNKEADDWLSNQAIALKVKAEAAVAPPAPVLPPPPPNTPPDKQTLALRYTGIAAGVLGLGLIIMGGAFVPMHLNRTYDACDIPAADCPRYSNWTPGIAFGFTAGALLLAGAGVMSYYGWRPAKTKSATLAPVGSSLHVRF
jgi:hypothetical protein